MKIKQVEYIGSYGYEQPFPRPLGPEFVFVGRSNVGKSSVINTLVGRKNIARTSNTPGKTRTANFYGINDAFCFVDVPGYGYAKVSKVERARWRKLTDAYLESREVLRGVVLLLDVRHSPSVEDREVSSVLSQSDKPLCLVFTKVDKINKSRVDRQIAKHLQSLSVAGDTAVVPFSAEEGSGKGPLWGWIGELLSL
jgi:GTP-binding protein